MQQARYIFVTCTPSHADQHAAEHAAILSDMPGLHAASTARAAATPIAAPDVASLDHVDHLIGQKPVNPAAATALRVLHDDRGMRLILGSNTQPGESESECLCRALGAHRPG